MTAVRVLVADDHRMVRVGIREMLSLSSTGMLCEVEEAETTEEVMEVMDRASFDVILMDVAIPGRGGAKATELILKARPDQCVLGVSVHDIPSFVEDMVGAGAKGYVLKNIEPDTLVAAIRTVMAGRQFYSNEVALHWLNARMARRLAGPLDKLSLKEKEILGQILEGLKNREIAARMYLSPRTVDGHRRHLMAKLGVKNAVELVQTAVRLGLRAR